MTTVEHLNQDWRLATEIHKLEARLWRIAQQQKLKVILFTSAVRGEGKSTTVAYLATALALHQERRIVVADFDFRDPRVNNHYHLEVTCGLGEVLRGEQPLEKAILKSGLAGLDLLLPASGGENPHLLFKTQQCIAIVDALRKDYDLVLIDVPALLPVADATVLMPLADGVVLVAMAGKSTKPQIRRAREICLGMGANILGFVVSNNADSLPGYSGTSYYYASKKESPAEGGIYEQRREP